MPGCITLARIPRGAISKAKLRTKEFSAPLEDAYTEFEMAPKEADMEETKTKEAFFFKIFFFRNIWVISTGA